MECINLHNGIGHQLRSDETVQTHHRNLGITLLPQAGVALGMTLTAATLPDGALARNVVLFAVLVYELIGPALTKRSLMAVGESKPEDRTSARRHNEPKMR